MNRKYPIVILDDDAAILRALQETLKREGYTCFGSTHAKEALEFIKQQTCAVVLSDQRMAEISGTDFLKQVKELQESCSRLLITGVLVSDMFLEAINTAEVFRCLAKPWVREQLLETVDAAYTFFERKLADKEAQQALLETNQALLEENIQLRNQLK